MTNNDNYHQGYISLTFAPRNFALSPRRATVPMAAVLAAANPMIVGRIAEVVGTWRF